jgi:hypothetical protein
LASGDAFANGMDNNINMFDFGMIRSVLRERDTAGVVTEKWSSRWLSEVKFEKKGMKPGEFLGSV